MDAEPASLQNIELSVGPQALGPVWSLRPALGQMGFARSRTELDAEPALGRTGLRPYRGGQFRLEKLIPLFSGDGEDDRFGFGIGLGSEAGLDPAFGDEHHLLDQTELFENPDEPS